MIEYTRKDIIMDPNDLRLEGAIGEKVYCSSDINLLLKNANGHKYKMTLVHIAEDADVKPFTVRDTNGDEFKVDFIIIKKEPKPGYVPFESIEEFLTAYFKSAANSECIQKTISSTGIWLKHNDAFLLVVEIWNRGVVIGDGKMETMKIGEDKYLTTNFVIDWYELYEKYTFLDGSPCGKEVK